MKIEIVGIHYNAQKMPREKTYYIHFEVIHHGEGSEEPSLLALERKLASSGMTTCRSRRNIQSSYMIGESEKSIC